MTVTCGPKALDRVRWWLYAPLVAVVAAGSVCAGSGVGSAAPDATAGESGVVAVVDAPNLMWYVKNSTSQAVWGEMHKRSAVDVSEIQISREQQLGSGHMVAADQPIAWWSREYTWGRICYRGAWWNLPQFQYGVSGGTTFDLVPSGDEGRSLLIRVNGDDDISLSETPGDSGCGTT